MIRPTDLPFLTAVCWQTADIAHLTPEEMLCQYERGWHYQGVLADLSAAELAFVQTLSDRYGSWIGMNTQLEFHQKIVLILHRLNTEFLKQCQVYFGGGTLLALQHNEYRLSRDIDFLCASVEGYRSLRTAIFDRNYDALFANRDRLTFPRDIQTNQYGVRFPVVVDGISIKFEIVSEGRIEFEPPVDWGEQAIACLNPIDQWAEKLLANSDRWLDGSVASRDLVDLAILRLTSNIPELAMTKAEAAYPVMEPLKRAIANFQAKPEYRERCYKLLAVRSPKAVIDGLDRLAAPFDLPTTERIAIEAAENSPV
jgi:Nucleotidyl transferase AbiEii toxin, Type IV TA system